MKRGQGAVGYIVIVAVVAIIVLIIISISNGLLGSGLDSEIQYSKSYWEERDISIIDYYLSASEDQLHITFQNNRPGTIEISKVDLGKYLSLESQGILQGGNVEYSIAVDCDRKNDVYRLPLIIEYSDIDEVSYSLIGEVNLTGRCVA